MKKQLSPNTIGLLGLREKVILVHSKDTASGNTISMRSITEEEEKQIDNISDKKDIYFYGDVDLNKEEDIKVIKDYHFISTKGNSWIHTNFDYDSGTFDLVKQTNGKELEYVIKEYPCIDPLTWFKYQHCLLGKPPKVIVYNNDYYEYFIKQRSRRK